MCVQSPNLPPNSPALSTTQSPLRRWFARSPFGVWLGAAYSLITLIFLYPLSLHPHAYLARIDASQLAWGCWWMMEAIQQGLSPFFTPLLYYPEGVSLYFHTLNPFYAFLSLPFQPLIGVVAAYNVIGMLVFISTAVGAAWLGTTLSGNRWGGFIAGIVFGFAPTHFFHFDVGQSQMQTVVWLPIYVLCLYHWLYAPHALSQPLRAGLRWLLGAVLAITLTSYVDWQLVVYLLIFSIYAALWVLLAQRAHMSHTLAQVGLRGALVGSLYALAVAPLLLPTLAEFRATEQPYMLRSNQDTIDHAADLLAFFIPAPYHPLWGAWSEQILDGIRRPGILITMVPLSYVALGLAAVAVWRNWPLARFWLGAMLLFLVLALGPVLRVNGTVTDVPLPYELLNQINIIRISRAPARYVIPAILCLAVLAAIGVAALQQIRMRPHMRYALPLGLAALLLFEYVPARMPRQPPPTAPPFLTDGTLARAGALLEVPNPGNIGMYYQILHQRPMLYGQTSRDSIPGPLGFHLRNGIAITDDMFTAPISNWHCALQATGFTHLLHYRQLGNEREQQRNAQRVATVLPATAPLRQHALADLYHLPPVDPEQSCLIVGAGWSTARSFGAGQPYYRWTGQTATLGVLQPQAGSVTITLHLHSFAIPRTLDILLPDGQIIAQFPVATVPAPAQFSVALPAGLTWLTLQSREEALNPRDFGFPETEPVAIGVSQASATRAE